MCGDDGINENMQSEAPIQGACHSSPLGLSSKKSGQSYSAQEIMNAYHDYKYQLYKEKYEGNVST